MKEKIIDQEITQELKQAYLDYAMSVIVARALPDVRDGLKPVQRRILYTMKELALWPQEKFTKCANIVGNTLARYHPHGDQSVYESLVRMAQNFSFRYPLIIGQGNFGSIDGDAPAAYRYTEAKLSQFAVEMLADIDKETVDFRPNYDNTRQEPNVLPAKIPNLLINGSLGIAVGMATSIPSHNLGEVMLAVKHLISHPQATIDDLLKFIKGPDFPTGGVIYGAKKLKHIYQEGKGGIVVCGKVNIEKTRKERLIIVSLPWQVNKSELVREIANLALEKTLPEIREVRDESNKEGIRVVIETRPGTDLEKLKKNLYRLTSLQKTVYFNLIALDNGLQPKLFSLKEILISWLEHRREVIRRRTKFELEKNKERVHLLEGFDIVLANLDKVINLIKKSKDKKEAMEQLMAKFKLSSKQADAILEMPLRTLTRLERDKILQELKERKQIIRELESILKIPKKIDDLIISEADEIIKKYPSPRSTEIIEDEIQISTREREIEERHVFLFIDQKNFVSLIQPEKLNLDKLTKGDSWPKILSPASTKDSLLLVSHLGRIFVVPLANFYHSAKYLESQITITKDDHLVKILTLSSDKVHKYLLLVTQRGLAKKIKMEEVLSNRRNGVQGLKLNKDDFVVNAFLVNGGETIGLISQEGNILTFKDNLSVQGKTAKGLQVIKGRIIGAFVKQSDMLLTIFRKGFYKKINLQEVKLQNRNTKGVRLFEADRYGELIVCQNLTEEKEVFIWSDKLYRFDINKFLLTKRSQTAKKIEGVDEVKNIFLI
ncbi:MAG: DNA topoisomerase 4 subunit A [Patescibacteria group bacterium]|nr:DNA topoisomerase 4 subunit A [Patescibacteria group bacterium]